MTLDELLDKFETPSLAAKVGGFGRTAAYHWFAKDEKRVLPGLRAIIRWANHFALTDEELGNVLRDRERLRDDLIKNSRSRRSTKAQKVRSEALKRRRDARKELSEKRKSAAQIKSDVEIERQNELAQKEQFLKNKEKQDKLFQMVEMLEEKFR